MENVQGKIWCDEIARQTGIKAKRLAKKERAELKANGQLEFLGE